MMINSINTKMRHNRPNENPGDMLDLNEIKVGDISFFIDMDSQDLHKYQQKPDYHGKNKEESFDIALQQDASLIFTGFDRDPDFTDIDKKLSNTFSGELLKNCLISHIQYHQDICWLDITHRKDNSPRTRE